MCERGVPGQPSVTVVRRQALPGTSMHASWNRFQARAGGTVTVVTACVKEIRKARLRDDGGKEFGREHTDFTLEKFLDTGVEKGASC